MLFGVCAVMLVISENNILYARRRDIAGITFDLDTVFDDGSNRFHKYIVIEIFAVHLIDI